MKVTFVFGGLPHYLIALLNKIGDVYKIDLTIIIPKGQGKSIGKGVKLSPTESNQKFNVVYLEEINSAFKKPYFRDFAKTIKTLKPDILVIGWPYIIPFAFDFKSRRIVNKYKIALVFREIPFMVAPKNNAISYYKKNPILNEDLKIETPKGLKFFFWAMLLNLIRTYYFKLVDATLGYSQLAYKIHESFGIPRDKIFVTYNSPDTENLLRIKAEIITQHRLPDVNTNKILHIGRLVKWKKVDLLIKAIYKIKEKNPLVELHIIGEGPEENNLRNLAYSKGLQENIKFLGSIYEPEQIALEILSSSVYVLAGMGGLSINEAMTFGKPVICSRCDGTEKELVRNGFNGFIFKEDDVHDLAEKISSLLNNAELRERMGKNSESIIQNEINLNTVAQNFYRCFSTLKSNPT